MGRPSCQVPYLVLTTAAVVLGGRGGYGDQWKRKPTGGPGEGQHAFGSGPFPGSSGAILYPEEAVVGGSEDGRYAFRGPDKIGVESVGIGGENTGINEDDKGPGDSVGGAIKGGIPAIIGENIKGSGGIDGGPSVINSGPGGIGDIEGFDDIDKGIGWGPGESEYGKGPGGVDGGPSVISSGPGGIGDVEGFDDIDKGIGGGPGETEYGKGPGGVDGEIGEDSKELGGIDGGIVEEPSGIDKELGKTEDDKAFVRPYLIDGDDKAPDDGSSVINKDGKEFGGIDGTGGIGEGIKGLDSTYGGPGGTGDYSKEFVGVGEGVKQSDKGSSDVNFGPGGIGTGAIGFEKWPGIIDGGTGEIGKESGVIGEGPGGIGKELDGEGLDEIYTEAVGPEDLDEIGKESVDTVEGPKVIGGEFVKAIDVIKEESDGIYEEPTGDSGRIDQTPSGIGLEPDKIRDYGKEFGGLGGIGKEFTGTDRRPGKVDGGFVETDSGPRDFISEPGKFNTGSVSSSGSQDGISGGTVKDSEGIRKGPGGIIRGIVGHDEGSRGTGGISKAPGEIGGRPSGWSEAYGKVPSGGSAGLPVIFKDDEGDVPTWNRKQHEYGGL